MSLEGEQKNTSFLRKIQKRIKASRCSVKMKLNVSANVNRNGTRKDMPEGALLKSDMSFWENFTHTHKTR